MQVMKIGKLWRIPATEWAKRSHVISTDLRITYWHIQMNIMKTNKNQDKTSKVLSGEITQNNPFATDLLYIKA